MLQKGYNKPNWNDNLQMWKAQKDFNSRIKKINKTNKTKGSNVGKLIKTRQCIGKGGGQEDPYNTMHCNSWGGGTFVCNQIPLNSFNYGKKGGKGWGEKGFPNHESDHDAHE